MPIKPDASQPGSVNRRSQLRVDRAGEIAVHIGFVRVVREEGPVYLVESLRHVVNAEVSGVAPPAPAVN